MTGIHWPNLARARYIAFETITRDPAQTPNAIADFLERMQLEQQLVNEVKKLLIYATTLTGPPGP